jgi:hypothetical protein
VNGRCYNLASFNHVDLLQDSSSGSLINAAAGSGYEFDAVHVVDVLCAINGIKSKAVGDDDISIEFLKMIFEF